MKSDELRREIFRQFSKPEIVKIAKELGVKINNQQPTTIMLKAIFVDLDEQGVPEFKDISDLLAEFLVASEYVDEQGNLLDDATKHEEVKHKEDEHKVDKLEPAEDGDGMPQCFKYSLADERDPSCKQCSVFQLCHKNRLANRPDCFGLTFDMIAEECKACIEAPFCRLEMEQLATKQIIK